MNVLIIDDDAEDREFFCEAVSELYPGFICIGISSREEVKETIARVEPDIIFMDGHMQPTSGAECLKNINNIIDHEKIKIIIHSGSLSPDELYAFEKKPEWIIFF